MGHPATGSVSKALDDPAQIVKDAGVGVLGAVVGKGLDKVTEHVAGSAVKEAQQKLDRAVANKSVNRANRQLAAAAKQLKGRQEVVKRSTDAMTEATKRAFDKKDHPWN